MIINRFPEIEIEYFYKNILFGGDRKVGVVAYSVIYDDITKKAIAVASLSLRGDFDAPEIVGVYVNENYRNKGYAKKLIKELYNFYQENKEKENKLYIQLINEDSARLDKFCRDIGLEVVNYN